ncbi:nucleolar and coiled-body phosphoprotein 1-like isoform X2 [Mastacembelus armatus]|uniref:nucleolar and coiled-body phosphoprotein 1-like isoform X2 n=1 Tax=Mastacembelus armatus TaxID=205130 RepID=UPI000E4572C6|nr:nucleolar and coiled-body phosphoprotein 1-like isoform X2 [Mastacembelus armatus]
MSVNASKHELLQLIYRHLKDHGFHTAADELQEHSPQVEKETSTSLLDVYNSWLKQPFSAKHSNSQKRRTPAKATKIQTPTASNQTQAEEDSSSDSESLSQSLLPQMSISELLPEAHHQSTQTAQTIAFSKDYKQKLLDVQLKALASPEKVQKSNKVTDSKGQALVKVAKTKAGVASPQSKTPKRKGVEHEGPDAEFTTAVSPFPLATPKKKKNTSVKKTDTQKKSVPAKRKRNGSESAGSVIKKSKSQTKDKSAGGDDSDSDSSLDVEKWKKLVLHMTEADIAKMDTINALVSTPLQPKKKRVRKPRANPPALIGNPGQKKSGTVGKNEKAVEKGVTESPTKNSEPKKSRQKKTATVTSSAIPRQEEHLNTVEDRPTAATLSPSKQTPVKKAREPETPREEKNDDTMSEPKKKKKKKKKESSEDKVEEKENETSEGGKEKDSKEEKSKKKEVTEQESGDRPVEEKKKTKGSKVNSKKTDTEDEMMERSKNGIGNDILQTIVEKKKAKKKKRKTDRDENSEQTAKEDKENSELVDEEAKQNSEQIVAEKKAKKKKTADSQERLEENESPEQIVKEKKAKKKKKEKQSPSEENSEQTTEEKKTKNKKKADPCDEVFEQIAADREEMPNQITEVKKKKKKDSLKNNTADPEALMEPLPPPNSETPSTEKKKKKHKMTSAEMTETPVRSVQDNTASENLQTPSSETHKKKKKSSKSTNS